MRRYVLSPRARADLQGIARYIAEAAGPTIATEVIGRIRARLELLAETPGEIGQTRPELGDAVRSFPIPPHVVFFRYAGEEVQVIRVLHERQDIQPFASQEP